MIHIVCGNPPVDVVDVRNLSSIVDRLKSGNEALAHVLPPLLEATMDDTGGLPVCESHKVFLLDEILTLLESANPQDQELLRRWLEGRRS